MTLGNDEIRERVGDPLSWFEHADSLFLAAEELTSSISVAGDKPAPQSDSRVLMLGLVRGAMTILGAGLECLLKGVAVSRNLLIVSDGRVEFSRSLQGNSKHDLVAMGRSLSLGLTEPEWGLLERASEYLSWAGRYPIARRLGRSLSAARQRTLTMNSNDVGLAKRLASRLRAEVFDAA